MPIKFEDKVISSDSPNKYFQTLILTGNEKHQLQLYLQGLLYNPNDFSLPVIIDSTNGKLTKTLQPKQYFSIPYVYVNSIINQGNGNLEFYFTNSEFGEFSTGELINILGSVNISNDVLNIEGNVNGSFSLTNDSINITGSVNVSNELNTYITNPSLNVIGSVGISNQILGSVEISNPSLNVLGSVNISNDITGSVSISNPSLNVIGSVNISNESLNVIGSVGISNQILGSVEISNPSLNVLGSVNVSNDITGSVSISNPSLNVIGSVNIANESLNVIGSVNITNDISGSVQISNPSLNVLGSVNINNEINTDMGSYSINNQENQTDGPNIYEYNPWGFDLSTSPVVRDYFNTNQFANIQQNGARGYPTFYFFVYNPSSVSASTNISVNLYTHLPTSSPSETPIVSFEFNTGTISANSGSWLTVYPNIFWEYNTLVVIPQTQTGTSGSSIGVANPGPFNLINSHYWTGSYWTHGDDGFCGFWHIINTSVASLPVTVQGGEITITRTQQEPITNTGSVSVSGDNLDYISASLFTVPTNKKWKILYIQAWITGMTTGKQGKISLPILSGLKALGIGTESFPSGNAIYPSLCSNYTGSVSASYFGVAGGITTQDNFGNVDSSFRQWTSPYELGSDDGIAADVIVQASNTLYWLVVYIEENI